MLGLVGWSVILLDEVDKWLMSMVHGDPRTASW
jgi:ATP-dependent Lon protease